MSNVSLTCDGCGQTATPEHVARRLQRLEWTTRWRPIHIGTLLLGACSPQDDANFLYSGKFEGEAGWILAAVGLLPSDKASDVVLAEFQRGGYFLTYMLECPLDNASAHGALFEALVAQRLPAVAARIRRSIKPKRMVLISRLLAPVASKLRSPEVGCAILPEDRTLFGLDTATADEESRLLRGALGL